MPTLVGRSSRHLLMAFRALHYSVSVFGLGKQLKGSVACQQHVQASI